MGRVIFLLEERSMKVLLDGLLPRLIPNLQFLCLPHEGKQDLEKSIPRKLRAWREPGMRFVVVCDNDGGDCHILKRRLAGMCDGAGRRDTLIRIACQELEAWYLGEPSALANAYGQPGLSTVARKARYRDPDAVQKPSARLARLAPRFQKMSAARLMATRLSEESNRSPSFRAFVAAVRRIADDLDGRQTHAAGSQADLFDVPPE